jgi:hypothetical protein
MNTLPIEWLQEYRARTFHLLPELRLKTQDEAIAFVKERGFTYFWPISGIILPNLWMAVAGDRPVADAHDDPGHVTWGWKDALLGSQSWYYAKILRKKATMLAVDVAPYFYALSENFGAYDEDYLTQYEQGRLTQEAKTVYEALLDKGPLDTVALRKAAHMSSPSSETRFNRALADLQADFKILPVAVTTAGAWHYAFAYDIVARNYPDLPEQAHHIHETQARQRLTELYLRSLGAARPADLGKLFGWRPAEVSRTIDQLVLSGLLRRGLEINDQPGEWIALAELLDG